MQSSLLVTLIGEAHESVTARLSSRSIRHNLRGLARGEASLEERDEDELVHLRAEVSNEDRELRTTFVAVVRESVLSLTRREGDQEGQHTVDQPVHRQRPSST